MRNKQQAVCGFTLIELLVVISIIALLISLLLPSLQSARAVARMMACQSRMRQFYVGAHAYGNDYAYWPLSRYSAEHMEAIQAGISGNLGMADTVRDFVEVMSPYIGSEPKDFREYGPSDNFWLCPANPIHAGMPNTSGNREAKNYAETVGNWNALNYWTTFNFGATLNSSTFAYAVPIDMVPGPRGERPRPGSPHRIIWLGELAGLITSVRQPPWRWPYVPHKQQVYFHPNQTTNMLTVDGAIYNNSGTPLAGGGAEFYSDDDLRFFHR